MAYNNLRGEMAKKRITIESIADLLGVHRNSAANKLNGDSQFSIEQAMKIQEDFFPEFELNYLFATEEDEKKGERR